LGKIILPSKNVFDDNFGTVNSTLKKSWAPLSRGAVPDPPTHF